MTTKKQMKSRLRKRKNKVQPTTWPGQPFPVFRDHQITYCDRIQVAEAAAAGGAWYLFAVNSAYDPDYTGVGHQPLYFDQLCSSTGPYLRYRVTYVEAVFEVMNVSNTQATVLLYPAAYTSTPSSLQQALEKPGCVVRAIAAVGSGNTQTTVRLSCPAAKVAGVTSQQYLVEDNFSGAYNASPTNATYFCIGVYSASGTIANTIVNVRLRMKTRFYSLGNEGTS